MSSRNAQSVIADALAGRIDPAFAALSLLLISFPDKTDDEKKERNKALGVWGAVAGAGGAVGLILGGMLTDWFGWEACFWVNVPIGVIAALLAPRVLPIGAPSGARGGFDLLGAFTVTTGLAGVVYVLVNAAKEIGRAHV